MESEDKRTLESGDEFECEFVVTQGGDGWLIAVPDYVRQAAILDGDNLEDNCFQDVPTEPGHYRARVEFEFIPGYYEGYPAPGESEWYFHVRECVDVLAECRQRRAAADPTGQVSECLQEIAGLRRRAEQAEALRDEALLLVNEWLQGKCPAPSLYSDDTTTNLTIGDVKQLRALLAPTAAQEALRKRGRLEAIERAARVWDVTQVEYISALCSEDGPPQQLCDRMGEAEEGLRQALALAAPATTARPPGPERPPVPPPGRRAQGSSHGRGRMGTAPTEPADG